MNRTICSALVGMLALGLAGCAQFTTSNSERAGLEAAAAAAGNAYLDCLTRAAGPYLATGENAQAITNVARKDCSAAREAAGGAQSALLSTRYILADPQVALALKALDDKGEAAIARLVLDRKASSPAAPAAPAAATAAAPAAASTPAAPVRPADGSGYLACMQAQGERYATVKEPAEVIAEVAHSRCAASLAGDPAAPQLERQGRALVMGLVLDRKAVAP